MKRAYSSVLAIAAASALFVSAGPAWAGAPVPAPLVGVMGPYGILVAGAAFGGYLLYKRFGNHR